MWINKEFPKTLILWFIVFALLCLTSLITPYWYDDTGHSLVVYQLFKTGLWAFPKEYPNITDYELHSTMISVGPALHYPTSWFILIFGWNFYYLKLVMVFINSFFVLIFYKFSQDFFHNRSYIFALIIGILNVQFMIYGSQYLGEVVMSQWILWGIYCQFLVLFKNKSRFYFVVSQLCFYAAILTKEYVALPLGLYLVFTWIYLSYYQKKWLNPLLFQGLTLPIASIVFYYLEFQNFTDFLHYWNLKKDYQAEFLSYSLEPFYFILKKPVILLGFMAMLTKLLIKRKSEDIFFTIFQTLLMFFFLLSKGFDRLGWILIPISALYLSEWIQFLWNFIAKTSFQKMILGIILLLFFSQNAVNPYYWKSKWNKKETLKLLASKIQSSYIEQIFTYEVEIIPYLDNVSIKTTGVPPVSSKRIQTELKEKYFLVGEYAKTEYQNTWRQSDYVKIWEYAGYEMWKLKTTKEF